MIGFSIYVAVYARRVRVPSGIKFHLAPGTIEATVHGRSGRRSGGRIRCPRGIGERLAIAGDVGSLWPNKADEIMYCARFIIRDMQ